MTTTTSQPLLTRIALALLWLFVFTMPLTLMPEYPVLGAMSRGAGVLALGVGIIAVAARKQVRLLGGFHMAMAGFIIWSAATLCWSAAPALTATRIMTYLQLFALVMLVWELCIDEQDVLRIAGAFVLGTMVPAISTLLAFLPGQQTLFDRAKAGVTPDEIAFILALSLPVSYYLILRDKSPTAALYRLHLGIAICAILMSGSPATMIAMAVGLSLFCWTFHLVPARTRLNIFAMAMLLGGAAIVFLPSHFWKTLVAESKAGTLSLAAVVDTGTAAVRSTPLGGYGAAAAVHVPAAKYFTLFSETGIIGVICFALMLAILFSAAERMGGATRSFWFTVLAVWSVGAWAFNLESSPTAWLLFALLAAHSASLRQDALTATERRQKQTFYVEQAEVWS